VSPVNTGGNLRTNQSTAIKGNFLVAENDDSSVTNRLWAENMLFAELEKGRLSGEEKGWLTIDEVEAALGVANDE
jgi:hypothetical protein